MRPDAPTLARPAPAPISRPALFRLLVAIARGDGLAGAVELLEADSRSYRNPLTKRPRNPRKG